jgi:hypothetical protein
MDQREKDEAEDVILWKSRIVVRVALKMIEVVCLSSTSHRGWRDNILENIYKSQDHHIHQRGDIE